MEEEGINVSNLSSALMSLSMLLPGLKTLWQGITTTSQAAGAAMFTAMQKGTIATIENTVATGLSEKTLKGKTSTQMVSTAITVAETLAEKLNWSEKKKGAAISTLKSMLNTAEATTEGGLTAATVAHTVAQWALNTAMGPFMIILMVVIGLVLAGIAAFLIFSKVISANNEAERQAKQAAIDTANANIELANSCQEAAEGVKSLTE
jgi:hypothetical protein